MTATSAGGTTTTSFTVTVEDKTAPELTLPANATVEATGPDAAIVAFAAVPATDLVDGVVAVSYSKDPGSLFPLGTTTVTVTATDAAGNTASGTFTITVQDTTPPVMPTHPRT